MPSEVLSMAAELMPRCAQHAAAARSQAAAVGTKTAAVRSIAAEGQHDCRGDA